MYVVPVLGWRRGELGLLEQTAPQVAQNTGVRLEEEEGDGRYREVGEGKQPFHPTGHTQARLPSSWRTSRNRAMEHTKAQGEPGSCEISMQVAPNRLTSLCLGTEVQHLISRLCHLSEDRLCPCICCLARHYHCSSTEGHPANTPTGLSGHPRPLGWLLLPTKLGFKGTI